MGITVTIALLAGLLLGTDSEKPTPDAVKLQRDDQNSGGRNNDVTIVTISGGAKYTTRSVKTELGFRARLEIPGVTIDAARLLLKLGGKIPDSYMQINSKDGSYTIMTVQNGIIPLPIREGDIVVPAIEKPQFPR